ncbi:hypothetical protein PROFUN_06430 [Planoprotostelium fungivorum]|uniref:Uncharacterized protein n=1 Tax=Planoprotostelium fungivorum TaxID=1890364 RepID=A0A2P6NNV1_9EUKA|nr:hypothetical protein PROFUN_06430 [Planoprotostelium fungivorum]
MCFLVAEISPSFLRVFQFVSDVKCWAQHLGCVAKHTSPEIIPYSGLRNSAHEKELNAGHINRAAMLRPPRGMVQVQGLLSHCWPTDDFGLCTEKCELNEDSENLKGLFERELTTYNNKKQCMKMNNEGYEEWLQELLETKRKSLACVINCVITAGQHHLVTIGHSITDHQWNTESAQTPTTTPCLMNTKACCLSRPKIGGAGVILPPRRGYCKPESVISSIKFPNVQKYIWVGGWETSCFKLKNNWKHFPKKTPTQISTFVNNVRQQLRSRDDLDNEDDDNYGTTLNYAHLGVKSDVPPPLTGLGFNNLDQAFLFQNEIDPHLTICRWSWHSILLCHPPLPHVQLSPRVSMEVCQLSGQLLLPATVIRNSDGTYIVILKPIDLTGNLAVYLCVTFAYNWSNGYVRQVSNMVDISIKHLEPFFLRWETTKHIGFPVELFGTVLSLPKKDGFYAFKVTPARNRGAFKIAVCPKPIRGVSWYTNLRCKNHTTYRYSTVNE